jgi:hypothetical protein
MIKRGGKQGDLRSDCVARSGDHATTKALKALLAQSPTPLARRELLARWPDPAPREDTLWRTLTRGVELGLFIVTGSGTKTDAFRYGPAGTPRADQQADGSEQAPIPEPC